MIFRDVRCVLTKWWLVAIGLALYMISVNIGVLGGGIDWLFILLTVHFFAGLFKIALQKRALGFGLYNLIAEMSFLFTVGIASNFLVTIILSESPYLAHQLGRSPLEFGDSIPWMVLPLGVFLFFCGLLTLGACFAARSYSNEPVID